MKKLISYTLLICMLATTIFTAPINVSAATADSDYQLVFSDDFEDGAASWAIESKSMICYGGKFASISRPSGTGATVKSSDGNLWNMPRIDVRFAKAGGDWSGFSITQTTEKGTGQKLFMFRRGEITDDGILEDYDPLKHSVDYSKPFDVRIEYTASNKMRIGIKAATSSTYTYSNETTAYEGEVNFKFRTSNGNLQVEDIKVYEPISSTLRVKERPVTVYAGSSVTPTVLSASGNVSYSIADTSVATVSGGKVTGVKAGTTTLTVMDGSGKSDTVDVVVLQGVDSLTFRTGVWGAPGTFAIKKGEVMSLTVQYNDGKTTPSDINLEWTSSNYDVIDFFGDAQGQTTVCAVGEGVAVVTATSLDGKKSESVRFVVTEDNTYNGVKTAIFELNNTKREIDVNMFGDHKLAVTSNSDEVYALYKDLGIRSIRAPYQQPDEGTADYYFVPHQKGYPQVVMLGDFVKKTADELVEEIDSLYNNLGLSTEDELRVEMGNEVYDGSISATDYKTRVADFAPKVKAKYPNIKLGIPIDGLGMFRQGSTFSAAPLRAKYSSAYVPDDTSYYDALIVHNYVTVSTVDAQTKETMMDSIYGSMELHRIGYDAVAESYPNKDIWLTEYGSIMGPIHLSNSDYNNKNRVMIGKSLGVGISNVQILLNAIDSGKVNTASYHLVFDNTGFGMVQKSGDSYVKFPTYYAFKAISDIYENNKYYYETQAMYCADKETVYHLSAIPNISFDVAPEVKVYAFGTANGVTKVVIANQTKDIRRVALNNYTLSKTWEYGSDNPLGNFLTGSESYEGIPSNIPQPTTFSDSEYLSAVDVQPYSLTVCDVRTASNQLIVSPEIPDGADSVLTDSSVVLNFNKEMSSAGTISFYDSEGYNVDFTTTLSGKKLTITPTSKLDYDHSYKVILNGAKATDGSTTDYVNGFKTIKWSIGDDYTQKEQKTSFIISNLRSTQYTSTNSYENFIMDLKVTKEERCNLAVKFRDTVELTFSGNTVTGPSNIGTGVPLTHLKWNDDETGNIRLSVIGPKVDIYFKKDGEGAYRKVASTFINVTGSASASKITVSSTWKNGEKETLSSAGDKIESVTIKTNQGTVSDPTYTQATDGTTFNLSKVYKGDTQLEFSANNAQVYYAEYTTAADGSEVLSKVEAVAPTGGSTYSIPVIGGTSFRIFIWDTNRNALTSESISN